MILHFVELYCVHHDRKCRRSNYHVTVTVKFSIPIVLNTYSPLPELQLLDGLRTLKVIRHQKLKLTTCGIYERKRSASCSSCQYI